MAKNPQLSLEQWSHIGAIVQAVAVVIGIAFAVWEIRFRESEADNLRKRATIDVHTSLGPITIPNLLAEGVHQMPARQREGVVIDMLDPMTVKMRVVSNCVQQNSCDQEFAVSLFCRYFIQYESMTEAFINRLDDPDLNRYPIDPLSSSWANIQLKNRLEIPLKWPFAKHCKQLFETAH